MTATDLGRDSDSASQSTFKLPIPHCNFKAYLFDCDGTIVDSMPLHYIAWSKALADWGCPFPEDRFYQWGGMPIIEIVERLSSEHGLNMPVHEVAERKERLYYDSLSALKPVPEVVEHIEAKHGHIPFAVVSGSTRESVEASLGPLGLLDRFDIFVCAGDYQRSKPDPEPFLIAAQRLGVAPEECLVFEDTQMGIDAAEAAGMFWVRVPPPSARS